MAHVPQRSEDSLHYFFQIQRVSDLKGTLHEKQEISGHKNASQTARYNRKISVVPVVGGQ